MYHDEEGDSKIHRSAYRIDSIGDTDSARGDIVRRRIKRSEACIDCKPHFVIQWDNASTDRPFFIRECHSLAEGGSFDVAFCDFKRLYRLKFVNYVFRLLVLHEHQHVDGHICYVVVYLHVVLAENDGAWDGVFFVGHHITECTMALIGLA